MNGYKCNNCGADLIVDENNLNITTCLYCGSNIAFIHKEYSDYNIKKIIPFSIDKETAIKKYCAFGPSKDIIEIKKVFLPVRFFKCGFSFFADYTYIVSDSEGRDSKSRIASLYDGTIDDGLNVFKSYYDLWKFFYKAERKDFDPVLLSGVSINFSNFLNNKKELEDNIGAYIKTFFHNKLGRIDELHSESYIISNLEWDDYVTLVPIFVVKCNDGLMYEVPGVSPYIELTRKKIMKTTIISIMLTIIILIIFAFFNLENLNFISIFIGFFIFWGIFLILLGPFLDTSNKRNIKYNLYNVSKNVKKFKY